MSIIDEVEALRRVPYFATLDATKLKLLAFASERFQLPAGGTICREGEPGDSAYILLDGDAEVQVTTAEGHPLTIAKAEKNTFIGEMAVLRNRQRNASVIATTPVTALKISRDAFFQLLRDVPQLALEVMRELAERIDDTTAKLRDASARLEAAGLS